MMTAEQRKLIRDSFAREAAELKEAIDAELKLRGGEETSVTRIDVMDWFIASRESLQAREEVLRVLDGGAAPDRNLVSVLIQEKKQAIDQDQQEISQLEKQIAEAQKRLDEITGKQTLNQTLLKFLTEDL